MYVFISVLPFRSRQVHDDRSEDLCTDDVEEVVQNVRNATELAPSRRRLRSAQRTLITLSDAVRSKRAFADDDETTHLMPTKKRLPPPQSPPVSFCPQERIEKSVEEIEEQIEEERRIPSPPSLAPVALHVATPVAMWNADARMHPDTTVLTRPFGDRLTASWAVALVAIGIFGGLMTAVVARGDLDFGNAAASASQTMQPIVPAQAVSPVEIASPPIEPVAAAPMTIGGPLPVTVPDFAFASQAASEASPRAIKSLRAKTPDHDRGSTPALARFSKPEPKKPKKDSKADRNVASAKEAQELAAAQLAASL